MLFENYIYIIFYILYTKILYQLYFLGIEQLQKQYSTFLPFLDEHSISLEQAQPFKIISIAFTNYLRQ